MLAATFRPVTSKVRINVSSFLSHLIIIFSLFFQHVPAIRNWFRRIDRLLARAGIQGGATSGILFASMFLGLFGSECGLHLAAMSMVSFRFAFSWQELPLVSWAIAALNIVFCGIYVMGGFATWLQLRSVLGSQVSRAERAVTNWKIVAMEMVLLVLSVGGVLIRSYYPGVAFKGGILFDEKHRLRLNVFYPANKNPEGKKLPVLLYLHGGSWISGNRGNVPSLLPYFASQGGVAISASYRLAPKHPFPAHIQDANAALKWVVANVAQFGGDPNWIVAAGGSAGAHLASLMVSSTHESHNPLIGAPFCGLISFYGVFDWGIGESDDDLKFRKFLSSVITRVPAEVDPGQFARSSPVHWFSERREEMKFPVLLVHGRNDSLVGVDAAESFARKLRAWNYARVSLVNLWLGHHAFDFFHSMRSLVLNYYTVKWIKLTKP